MTSIYIKPLKAYWRSLILYSFIPLLLGGFFVVLTNSSSAAFNPACTGNQPPVAVIEPTNPVIELGETVVFSASKSTDPDANSRSGDRFSRIRSRSRSGSKPVLVYNWVVPAFDIFYEGKTFEFTPPRAGWFSVDLKVTDDCGAIDWASISLQVIETQPEELKVDLVVDDIYFKAQSNGVHVVMADICNIGNKDFVQYDWEQITYQIELNNISRGYITSQALSAGECYSLYSPSWLYLVNPYTDAGNYEVSIIADYWEGAPTHTNVIDELDETNNELTKTIRISALENALWHTGYLYEQLERSVTITVGYDFIKEFQAMIKPIRLVYEKYNTKINIHLIFASKNSTSGHHKAAQAVECIEDQDKQFVIDLLGAMEQDIWPYGFSKYAWANYASEIIGYQAFDYNDFITCLDYNRNSQDIYNQMSYADYLGLNAGQVLLQNHNDGTSQLFEASEINFENLDQAVKDSLGIVDPQVPSRGSFGRLDRASGRR